MHQATGVALAVLAFLLVTADSTWTSNSVVLRVGVSLPAGNQMVGLPAIAESLSSERLFGLAPDGRPTPAIVERWTTSNGGLDLHLTLSGKLILHNGSRADAATIAGLLRDVLEKAGALQMVSRLKNFYEIRPENASTLLLRSRSARILALEELANITLKIDAGDGGLGPFVVDSLNADGIRLHGFQQYFRGAPRIDRVEFQLYRSQRAAWTGMMRDATDALYEVNREAVDFIERESRVRTHSFLRPYVSGIVFNVSRPMFRDARVRRALAAAVNRQAIVQSVYRGRADTADGPLAPTYWALAPDSAVNRYSPPLASSLLAHLPVEARAEEMPARIRFRCLVPTFETQPFERIALVVQKQLYDFGVDMELEAVPFRALVPRLSSGDFDAVLMEFFGMTPSWLTYFWHSPSPGAPVLIQSGYSGADRELESMDAARNEEELRNGISGVYRKLSQDPPAIFIAWPEVTRAVSARFEVPVEKGRDIMGSNLWLWRPAKSQ